MSCLINEWLVELRAVIDTAHFLCFLIWKYVLKLREVYVRKLNLHFCKSRCSDVTNREYSEDVGEI